MHMTGAHILSMAAALWAVGVSVGVVFAAPQPIVEYRFDEAGTEARNTGSAGGLADLEMRADLSRTADLHTPEKSGVSGKPGDRAFNNEDASTAMGNLGTGGVARGAKDVPELDGLRSLTVTGWLRHAAKSPGSTGARILNKGDAFCGFEVMWGGHPTGGGLRLTVNGKSADSPPKLWADAVSEWVFFAVTWEGDASTNNVHFYHGEMNSPAKLVGMATLAQTLATNSAYAVSIGNAGQKELTRPFKGWMDHVRVFGSQDDASGALKPPEIEALRASDVRGK